jgi:hypothetical protein
MMWCDMVLLLQDFVLPHASFHFGGAAQPD